MPGPIQEPEAFTMPAQLLHGTVHGRPRRLRASPGEMSRMPCGTSYTIPGERSIQARSVNGRTFRPPQPAEHREYFSRQSFQPASSRTSSLRTRFRERRIAEQRQLQSRINLSGSRRTGSIPTGRVYLAQREIVRLTRKQRENLERFKGKRCKWKYVRFHLTVGNACLHIYSTRISWKWMKFRGDTFPGTIYLTFRKRTRQTWPLIKSNRESKGKGNRNSFEIIVKQNEAKDSFFIWDSILDKRKHRTSLAIKGGILFPSIFSGRRIMVIRLTVLD